jgi:hypothetical protein
MLRLQKFRYSIRGFLVVVGFVAVVLGIYKRIQPVYSELLATRNLMQSEPDVTQANAKPLSIDQRFLLQMLLGEDLAEIPQIERVRISGKSVALGDLRHISSLRNVWFDDVELGSQGLSCIANLHLQRLWIFGKSDGLDLTHLRKMSELRKLVVGGRAIQILAVKGPTIPQIEHLGIVVEDTADLKIRLHWERVENIQSLSISSPQTGFGDLLIGIGHCKQLKQVSIADGAPTAEDAYELGKISTLTNLELARLDPNRDSMFFDELVKQINLDSVELQFRDCGFKPNLPSNQNCWRLPSIASVTIVELVGDEIVDWLLQIKGIKKIDVQYTQMTREGALRLVQLKSLKRLVLPAKVKDSLNDYLSLYPDIEIVFGNSSSVP